MINIVGTPDGFNKYLIHNKVKRKAYKNIYVGKERITLYEYILKDFKIREIFQIATYNNGIFVFLGLEVHGDTLLWSLEDITRITEERNLKRGITIEKEELDYIPL